MSLIDVTDKRRARKLSPAIFPLFETSPAIYLQSPFRLSAKEGSITVDNSYLFAFD